MVKGAKVCRSTMWPEFKSRGEVFCIKMTIPVLLRLSDVFSYFPNFLYFTFKIESHITYGYANLSHICKHTNM